MRNKSGNFKKNLSSIIWLFILVTGLGFSLYDMITPYTFKSINENSLLEAAKARILKIRRGTYSLEFGSEFANKSIYIRQLSHAFKFGANTFNYNRSGNPLIDQIYTEYFSKMFNYGVVPFYWRTYQPKKDEENIEWQLYLHNITAWLSSFNATPKGHPIIWEHVPSLPLWLNDVENKTDAALERIEKVLLAFPEIKIWDLVNEMTHLNNTLLGKNAVETWEVALAKARSVRPDCEFIANEYDTVGPGDAATMSHDGGKFYKFVEKIVADGFAPNALGFQFHCITEFHSLQDIIDTFDSFGRFKIPCHITEFIPASKGYYTSGVRRGLITEQSQAEWAVRAYTMLFSHPAIYSIVWWDLCYYHSWKPELGAYMIDQNGRILPVYNALYNLIHVEWNSTGIYQLDEYGSINFTGFYGDYEAIIEGEGPSIRFSIQDLRSKENKPWRIDEILC